MLGRRTPPAVGALQLFQLSAVRRACNVQEYHVLVFCRRPWRLRHGSSNRGCDLPIPFTQGHRITAQAEGVSVPTPQSPSAADYLALLSTFPGMVFRRQNDEPGTLTFGNCDGHWLAPRAPCPEAGAILHSQRSRFPAHRSGGETPFPEMLRGAQDSPPQRVIGA